jgi:hypothetical protein
VKRSRPLIAAVADDLRQRAAKRPKQFIIHVGGCGAGVTFTPAEEVRVRAKAARLSITVEELIEGAVNRRLSKSRRPVDEVVVSVVKTLGAPSKKRKAA